MGDHAVAGQAFSAPLESGLAAPAGHPVPASTLARWAAIAAERACYGAIPRQPEIAA